MRSRIAKKIVRNTPTRNRYRRSTVVAAHRRMGLGLHQRREEGVVVTIQWRVSAVQTMGALHSRSPNEERA